MFEKGSRHSKIMQVFELQNDFLKHRQKIIKTQRRDVSHHIKKSYYSQMEMINSFRKNWLNANAFKFMEKQKQISHNNKLLHQSLHKQYNRQRSTTGPGPSGSHSVLKRMNSSNSLSRTSLISSHSKSRKDLKINQQNERLMKKILSIESSLAHDKLKSQYRVTKRNKQKLQVYSSKNKERLRNSLRKMNIQPTVYFPRMKQKYSTLIK